jgi:hypothetical protein
MEAQKLLAEIEGKQSMAKMSSREKTSDCDKRE